jgi:putative transposase
MPRFRRAIHRKSIRLKGYDYSTPGGYFVTQGIQSRRQFLASRYSGKIVLTDFGLMVQEAWFSMEIRFSRFITMDTFVIMPDHIHGIIFINDLSKHPGLGPGTRPGPTNAIPSGPTDAIPSVPAASISDFVPADTIPSDPAASISDFVPAALVAAAPKRPKLGDIMGAFKSITTLQYIRGVQTLGWDPFEKRIWQRMYYEHIIRSEADLRRIRRYIINNPFRILER